jgi:anti-sigma regulatory factor (Ser/Thr protein kinase)
MQALPTSSAHIERIFASCAAVLRLGAVVLLVATVPDAIEDAPPARLVWTCLAAAESVVYAVAVLRAGRLPVSWSLLDQLAVAAAVAVTGWPLTAGTAESPLYNYALTSIVAAGMVAWPWWAALATTLPVAAALVLPALLARHPAAPAWTLVPDGTALACAAMIAWAVTSFTRRFARAYDHGQRLLLRRAGQLAQQRERVRHGVVLQARLLATLTEVVDSDAVTVPAFAGQLGVEVRWLRQVIESGLPEPPAELLAGLRDLAQERSTTSLRVDVESTGPTPQLPDEVRAALLEATREALTNVMKHAGVAAAVVRVTTEGGVTTVEIIDRGRGHDPAAPTSGLGRARSIVDRMTAVGGTADVHSALGLGTRVVLRTGDPS